jgi:hypothetical protein
VQRQPRLAELVSGDALSIILNENGQSGDAFCYTGDVFRFFRPNTACFLGPAIPIYPTSALSLQAGTEFTFEVRDVDAGSLRRRLGTLEHYMLDSQTFWATLISLEPCRSTHIGLALLRDKPRLRGVLRMKPAG